MTAFDQFWRALSNEFQGLERFLVLIFAGTTPTSCLVGITELPTPKFEPYEIAQWTSEVSQRMLGWPQTEVNAWTELIKSRSLDDQQRLDPFYLYDALGDAIKAIRTNEANYYRMLRERSQGAIATSH